MEHRIVYYWDNHSIQGIANFKNGDLHGGITMYDLNSMVTYHGTYCSGNKCGWHLYFENFGTTLKYIEYYENSGVLIWKSPKKIK